MSANDKTSVEAKPIVCKPKSYTKRPRRKQPPSAEALRLAMEAQRPLDRG